jgi:hypothetical protein
MSMNVTAARSTTMRSDACAAAPTASRSAEAVARSISPEAATTEHPFSASTRRLACPSASDQAHRGDTALAPFSDWISGSTCPRQLSSRSRATRDCASLVVTRIPRPWVSKPVTLLSRLRLRASSIGRKPLGPFDAALAASRGCSGPPCTWRRGITGRGGPPVVAWWVPRWGARRRGPPVGVVRLRRRGLPRGARWPGEAGWRRPGRGRFPHRR